MKAKKMTIREMIANRNQALRNETGHLAKVRRSYKRKYTGERLELALKSLDLYKLRCTINRDISVVRLRINLLAKAGKPKSQKLNREMALLQYNLSQAIREEDLTECKKAVLDGTHTGHMVLSFSTLGFHKVPCKFGLPISEKAPVKA